MANIWCGAVSLLRAHHSIFSDFCFRHSVIRCAIASSAGRAVHAIGTVLPHLQARCLSTLLQMGRGCCPSVTALPLAAHVFCVSGGILRSVICCTIASSAGRSVHVVGTVLPYLQARCLPAPLQMGRGCCPRVAALPLAVRVFGVIGGTLVSDCALCRAIAARSPCTLMLHLHAIGSFPTLQLGLCLSVNVSASLVAARVSAVRCFVRISLGSGICLFPARCCFRLWLLYSYL